MSNEFKKMVDEVCRELGFDEDLVDEYVEESYDSVDEDVLENITMDELKKDILLYVECRKG